MTMAARLPLRHPSLRRGRKVAQSCEKWRGATGDVSGRKHWARVKPEMPLSREKEPSWPAGKACAWRGKQPNLVPHEPRAGGGHVKARAIPRQQARKETVCAPFPPGQTSRGEPGSSWQAADMVVVPRAGGF